MIAVQFTLTQIHPQVLAVRHGWSYSVAPRSIWPNVMEKLESFLRFLIKIAFVIKKSNSNIKIGKCSVVFLLHLRQRNPREGNIILHWWMRNGFKHFFVDIADLEAGRLQIKLPDY